MKPQQRSGIANIAARPFASSKQRQDVINNVKSNVAMYLGNRNIIARYRTQQPPIISIVFTSRSARNAYAKSHGNLTYEIGFEDGLLAFFRHFSSWLSNEKEAFPNLDKKHQQHFSDYMMYCWADLVGFHEWSHILLGHVGQVATPLNEAPDERQGLCEAALSRAAEYEADTWGAKFSFARISTITSHLQGLFYQGGSKLDVYEDFGFIVYSLFKQLEEFERLEGGGSQAMLDLRRTHPDPIVRTWFMKKGVSEALDVVSKAEQIDPKKLKMSFWAGVTRARQFYGDGPLKVIFASIYYVIGLSLYPVLIRIRSPQRLF
jgi:hypothetical protein